MRSSLAAVGFLAAVCSRLAEVGISVNPVSGFHHDHLFVPWERREEALAVLERLAGGGPDATRASARCVTTPSARRTTATGHG